MRKFKGVLLLGIVMIVTFGLTGCGSTTVDLNKYITIEVDGYNSMGNASYYFDEDAFYDDLSDKITYGSKEKNEEIELEMLFYESAAEAMLDFCVDQNLNQATELSNGDEVTLTWDCEDEVASEYFKCKLKYSDISYTVSNLEEVGYFNPFEYIEVSFSGTAPDGQVNIIKNENIEEMKSISFTTDKTYELSNGDNITITVNPINTNSFVEQFGTVLEKTEMSYVVEGLPYYVTDINDIPSELMEKMIKQGEDVFRADVARWWNNPEQLNSISMIGNYFLTLKPGMTQGWGSSANYLYVIYKISATNPNLEQDLEYYYYVAYDSIIMLGDGTCSVDTSKYASASNSFFAGNLSYHGYESKESLFSNCVTKSIDMYEYTSSVE